MVTRGRIRNSIWPYLGTIACLLLSLVVPYVWRINQRRQEIRMLPGERFEVASTDIEWLGGNDDAVYGDHSGGGTPIFLREFARPTMPVEPDHVVASGQIAFTRPAGPAGFEVAFNAFNTEVRTKKENAAVKNEVMALDDVAFGKEFRTQPANVELTGSTTGRLDAAPKQTREQPDGQTDDAHQIIDTYNLSAARDAGLFDGLRDINVHVPTFEDSFWNDPEWPESEALLDQIQRLGAENNSCTAWCDDVLAQLQHLTTIPTLGHDDAAAVLGHLRELATDGRRLVADLDYGDVRTAFSRAIYALERRLNLWETLQAIASRGFPAADEGAPAPQDILESLDKIQRILAQHERGIAWSNYLLLEDLRLAVTNERTANSSAGCELAQRIVRRIETTPLTKEQRAYLAKPQIEELVGLLRPWTCQDVDYTELLKRVERYEQANRQNDGRFLAEQVRWLKWSPSDDLSRVGGELNRHWRNANIRVAISGKLLNRYLPKPKEIHGHVNDYLAGSSVYGSSWTTTQLRWHLIPDARRIRMELEARGNVRSQTTADLGNVRTHNHGSSNFNAKKTVLFDNQGLHTKQAVATAQSSTSVTGIDTNFDGIPFIGAFAQSVARSRASERIDDAERLTKQRVAAAAERQLNKETKQRLGRMKEQYYDRLFNPLENIGLNPTPISFQTTDRRVIARYRLAGHHQLAAHSPRPMAPSNSLLSVQLHQSALNNLVEQLELNGKKFDLDDLYAYIPQKLGKKAVPIPDDVPENLMMRFAATEPIRFTFADGRARITIRLASLSKGRRKRWRNVTVRGDYLPDRTAVDAYLFREESIQLTGHHLGFSDQVALRGIFSKVLSRKRKYALLQESLARNPQFADLRINRFVIQDGWICVAWSTQRLANVVGTVRR